MGTNNEDSRADTRKNILQQSGYTVRKVAVVDVYTVEATISQKELISIANLLSNPVTQSITLDEPSFPVPFSYAIEIGFLPGVTDNVGTTARETAEDSLKKKPISVYTSQITFIDGNLTKEDAVHIAESMYNPLIQRAEIKSFAQYKKESGMSRVIPKVELANFANAIREINLEVSDEALETLGSKGITNADGSHRGPLALDLLSMKTIQAYFKKRKRNPTDIELESLAQTWSEHCKHTIFANPIDDCKKGLYKSYIKAATEKIRSKLGTNDFCASVFTDNSGAILFDKQYYVTHKTETHNSPSALDPFGGAITGICGVNRDAIGFGMGAKPIVNTYGFCLAYPDKTKPLYRDKNLTQKMLSPQRIMDGVIAGINSGGNCSGIPGPQGFLYFDERYKGKPLVFAGTVGLIPQTVKDKPSIEKRALPGDLIVVVGGKVGKDGIHGATFSSVELDSKSPVTAVQIGDPITQKKLSDAVIKEARDLGLYHSITDNGAGGLSCSVAEMAKESGGCVVEIEKVPLKYAGLSPWEIWISESQERMTFAIPKQKWSAFQKLMQKRGVEATVIGVFTEEPYCIVKQNGTEIMHIDMAFLHDGLPLRQLYTKKPAPTLLQKEKQTGTLKQRIFAELSAPSNASYAFVSQQYDHTVQGGCVLGPLQGRGQVNADATVIRPLLTSQKAVALTQSLYPSYSELDPYRMAAACIDTAIRQLVCIGADPQKIALLDNFCWCSSTEPERLWQLKKAAEGCYDYAVAFSAPFISGKDSMFNDFKGFDEEKHPVKISIPPTLLISAISVIEDSTKVVSIDVKSPGDLIYLIGETNDEQDVPHVDTPKNKKIYDTLFQAIQKELINSALSIGRGGLALALMKTLIAGKLGASIQLDGISGTARTSESILFSESMGRIIVSISEQDKKRFETLMRSIPCAFIGTVTESPEIKIMMKQNAIVSVSVPEAESAYKQTFAGY